MGSRLIFRSNGASGHRFGPIAAVVAMAMLYSGGSMAQESASVAEPAEPVHSEGSARKSADGARDTSEDDTSEDDTSEDDTSEDDTSEREPEEPRAEPTEPEEPKTSPTPAAESGTDSDDGPAFPKEHEEPDFALVDASVVTRMTTAGEGDRRSQDAPVTRWSEVGGFVGMVSRASSEPRFKYHPGIAYGGYFRPQLNKYLAVRLAYREERISVSAEPGAYDYGGETQDLDLEQPNLKVTNLGLRIEPSLPITSYLHLVGALSWSWSRLVARMPEAEDFSQRADRAAVELNWGLGGGVEVDLLKNWLSLSCIGSYHFVTNQTGSAYDPIQAIVDGQMTQFAPLARPKNMVDLLFSIGLIL